MIGCEDGFKVGWRGGALVLGSSEGANGAACVFESAAAGSLPAARCEATACRRQGAMH